MIDSTQVNWPQVADKILEYGKNGILKLAEGIEEIAPKAWEIVYRQVWADMALNIFVAIILLASAWKLMSYFYRKYEAQERNYREGEVALCVIWGTITFIISIYSLLSIEESIKIIINPDYYAILKLLELGGLK